MIGSRLGSFATGADCTDPANNSSWGSYPECRYVGLIVYASQLYPAQKLVASQTIINSLDNSFRSVGNRSNPTNDPFVSTMGPARLALRVVWGKSCPSWMRPGETWVSTKSSDPNALGTPITFPLPYKRKGSNIVPLLWDVYEDSLDLWRSYLRAKGPTSIQGVSFSSCPCSYPSVPHARAIHVLHLPQAMATTEGSEMQVGYGQVSDTTYNIAAWSTADGGYTTPERRVEYLNAWTLCSEMHEAKLGDTVRSSLAYGGVFGGDGWTNVRSFIDRQGTLYGDSIVGMITNLRQDYYTKYNNDEAKNWKDALIRGASYGQPIGWQTASTQRQPWGAGFMEGMEHVFHGTTGTAISRPSGLPLAYTVPASNPYTQPCFIESVPGVLGFASTPMGAMNSGAVGWPYAQNTTSRNYFYGSSEAKVYDTRILEPIYSDTEVPPPVPQISKNYIWSGSSWEDVNVNVWDGYDWRDLYEDAKWYNGTEFLSLDNTP